MRIAIVGTGVSGLTAARELHATHDLTIFEAGATPGGHVNTVDVEHGGRVFAVDTGFIVFNDRTYPGFVRMLAELGVASRPTTMSFSVRHEAEGLEYNGHSLGGLLAQKRNAVRPGFWRMLRDIVRIGRECGGAAKAAPDPRTLGEFLARGRYSREFAQWYLMPMASAIWSAPAKATLELPLEFFTTFFRNHGFFDLLQRPTWRTVVGGSRRYVEELLRPMRGRLRLSCPVRGVRRLGDRVEIESDAGAEAYDAVVIAVHADTALGMLRDPSVAEREVLGAIRFHRNGATLHTDTSLMPRRRRAWAAWNAHVGPDCAEGAGITYNMNILQGLNPGDGTQFMVSLNRDEQIDPAKVIRRMVYDHPVYSTAAFAAQRRHGEISGVRRTYYAGAYWRYGFHEDGHSSAVRVAEQIRGVEGSHGPARVARALPAARCAGAA